MPRSQALGRGDASIDTDVADEGQVVTGVARAVEALGRLDVAVINAGVGGFSPVLGIDDGRMGPGDGREPPRRRS